MTPPFIDTDAGFHQRVRRASDRNVEIMARWFAGESQKALAREYGVSQARVWQIVAPLRMRNLRMRRVGASGRAQR